MHSHIRFGCYPLSSLFLQSVRDILVVRILRENKNSIKNKSKQNNNKSSTYSTYSQSESQKSIIGPLITPSVAHFNHMMNISFDIRDVPLSVCSSNPFQDTPTIHFQVYSLSLMDRYVLEGYGYYHVPGQFAVNRAVVTYTVLSHIVEAELSGISDMFFSTYFCQSPWNLTIMRGGIHFRNVI